ncbi:MAG: hypothetical protein U0Q18_12380 [Bryobacteraceae bacterium]
MSELLRHSEHSTALVEDERWCLVQRIASSRHLLKASQLREILLYVSRRALTDHPSTITEQEIGCKVLGRRPDFNPNEDNIVRAQVRHLRRKLEEYFQAEGADEPILLTIPKGAYVVRFEPRVPVRQAESFAPLLPTASRGETGVAPEPHSIHARRWTIPVGALVIVLALGLFALWRHRSTLPAAISVESRAVPPDALWSKIFGGKDETSILMSDANLVMLQDILDKDIPLSEYLDGAFPERLLAPVPNRELHSALQLIAGRQYTSLGDASVATKLIDVGRRYTTHVSVRYSRYLSVREFKSGNFILIGSRRGIPWEQLFEPQLNFYLEEDHRTRHYHFRNRAPAAGEREIYTLSSDGPNQESYADIALLPNLSRSGYVLILAGIDMAATEAAGEFVMNADFPAAMAKLFKPQSGGPPVSYIEMLIKAKVVGGTAEDTRIVAHRLIR